MLTRNCDLEPLLLLQYEANLFRAADDCLSRSAEITSGYRNYDLRISYAVDAYDDAYGSEGVDGRRPVYALACWLCSADG